MQVSQSRQQDEQYHGLDAHPIILKPANAMGWEEEPDPS